MTSGACIESPVSRRIGIGTLVNNISSASSLQINFTVPPERAILHIWINRVLVLAGIIIGDFNITLRHIRHCLTAFNPSLPSFCPANRGRSTRIRSKVGWLSGYGRRVRSLEVLWPEVSACSGGGSTDRVGIDANDPFSTAIRVVLQVSCA